jgi:cytochrome c553
MESKELRDTPVIKPIHSVVQLTSFVAMAVVSLSMVRSQDGTPPRPDSSKSGFTIPKDVNAVFASYCVTCHGEKKQSGKVRLDTIAGLGDRERLALLNKVQKQVHLEEMPPEGEKQSTKAERKLLADWIGSELDKSGVSELDDKLRYPDYGNSVPHETLFSGQVKDKAFTPARRWLVSPQIFEERVLDIFKLEGREREEFKQKGLFGVTNPFVLPDHSGVRYYDISALDGGHLLVMLTNADWISQRQIRAARVKNGEIKADEFENPKDRWVPKTPEAFEKIILNKSKPAKGEIVAAVQAQFALVLRRPATDSEVKKYLDLTISFIEIGGNTEGLRQMLVSVILESEFLYRLEFGVGQPDQHGRKLLSPREASFAISYALGDRNPDPLLVKAAQEGRLNSKEDYRREVSRLLKDENYYKGQIDKNLNGLHLQSNVTSHPKIIRFFREFFGYPNALKVFKDNSRLAYYSNPDRGTTGTPGSLILEADRIVDWYVRKDADVFANLLTTDKFFVYHNVDNEKGSKIVADWKELYDTFKDTDWRKNPAKVFAEHEDLLKKHRLELTPKGVNIHSNTLTKVMEHLSYTLGKGNTPFTTFPWTHGYHYNYSQLYGLPTTPGIGGQYGGNDNLNYQVVQPFPLENRKGILTHPAWLIAHSSNLHTDPIRRGRWIREKLLAGRVPDVPITVDAQVPEDPHKTFRERVEGVTGQQACWKCHQHMNPLGYAFEVYDDFGRYRHEESLENPENLVAKAKTKHGADVYKTKPVNAAGELNGTGNPQLDGKVNGAIDMIDRLAKSERTRQSIIRHAFRFYMGRNEMLSDSQTLIDADKAYVESGGSFRAVIVSLLTSDSFMYRK